MIKEPTYMITLDTKLDVERICLVCNEDGEDFIGTWVYGFGVGAHRFPKKVTRPMTMDEVDNYNSYKFRKARMIPFQLSINYDGTVRIRKD